VHLQKAEFGRRRTGIAKGACGAQSLEHVNTLLPAILLFAAALSSPAENPATLRISVTAPDGSPLPCRVHLTNAAGDPVRPQSPKLPFWKDHFVCDGSAELSVPAGDLRYQIERGPEWSAADRKVAVKAGEILRIEEKLTRIADLGGEGWWGGDTHVHRAPADVPLLMRAEDLHIASVLTWWNDADAPAPSEAVGNFDGNRFFHSIGGEDERAGGALLFHNLAKPLPLARFPGKTREWPASAKFLDDARKAGAFIEAEKPFWRDYPVWLARGVDAVGIAHNHMQRSGVMDNEAWGRARELAEFPGTQGNGFYSQRLYYRALNCGLRIPPIAGSASGVLPNPVGYNRAFVHCDGPLTWEKWWAGLRAGRVFVTNGPLLRLTANGQLPGATLKTDGGPLQVNIAGRLDSRDPIKVVELVRNNRIERITLPAQITINDSGWFLVRALADVPHTFRFASTAPWYVELGTARAKDSPVDRASPQFFLSWTREQLASLKLDDPAKRAEALAPWQEAERFWVAKIAAAPPLVKVTGRITDAASGELLPARLYLRRDDGRWFFPIHDTASTQPPGGADSKSPATIAKPEPSDDPEDDTPQRTAEPQVLRPPLVATRYEKRNWINPKSAEHHTALGAGAWSIELEPGRYTFTAERGKEWLPATQEIVVGKEPATVALALKRFANLAEEGWFSGDTHVHRTLDELPTAMLADDLNVAFPLTHWVTKGGVPPTEGDKNMAHKADAPHEPRAVYVDATHAYWPLNTEWEIFSLGAKRHTLGAIFALGHAKPFAVGAPPLGPLAFAARDQRAMLDIDKPDWPWALALPPVTGARLYELANNHMWRTEFAFTKWTSPAPAWMLPNAQTEGTERDWIEYTHRAYWTLLDCGQRMVASAGTASGVHPVPVGFGRVYAHCGPVFRYELWRAALQGGRSFATTGPLLVADCDGEYPGKTWPLAAGEKRDVKLRGRALSERAIESIEVIVNGAIVATLKPSSRPMPEGGFETKLEHPLSIAGTSWIALRCWEPREDGRVRFAHTSPWWFDDASRPLRPRREEPQWLAARVRTELERSRALLTEDAVAEYEYALRTYEDLIKNSRER
jgi:hypothetical protein